jgi:hypothetical protein
MESRWIRSRLNKNVHHNGHYGHKGYLVELGENEMNSFVSFVMNALEYR